MDGATFVDRFDELFAVGYRAGYAVLGRRAEAEDCAQEAMARALARWSRVHDHAAAWVARVATNLALDRVRKLERQRRHQPRPAVVDDPVALRRHDLVHALRALPARLERVAPQHRCLAPRGRRRLPTAGRPALVLR